MSEEIVDPEIGEDADIVAEVDELVKPDSEKDRDKVKAALIATKRELRASKRENAALKPIADRATSIDERLANAQPYIDAIVNNPQLKAAALRAVNGTRTSSDATVQPDADDDPDAAEFAEIHGMYLADGQTHDLARAQRAMKLQDRRSGKQADERIRPVAGFALNRQANDNLRGVYAATDDDGVPLATQESIKEAVDMMRDNPALMANPQVVDMLLNQAIGLDRRKGRTPKAPDEPLYLASPGGGRHSGDGALDPEMRAFAKKYGIDEKEALASVNSLERGIQSRKGVTFGGSK